MRIQQKEIEVRQYSDDKLLKSLEIKQFYDRELLFIVCDELLMRKITIAHLNIRFETLVRSLSKSFLVYIEKYDYAFCKASVHVAISELQKRGKNISQWFTLNGAEQSGPYSRLEIEKRILDGEIEESNLIWKEGMSEWQSVQQLSFLSQEFFFNQDFNSKSSKEVSYQNTKTISKSTQSSSSIPLLLGVLEIISFPFWLVLLFVVPFSSIGSVTGLSLPIIMVLFSLVSCIPIGIALIRRKHWAWSVKVVSTILIIIWFVLKVYVDDANTIWLVFTLYEIIILTFAFIRKDLFNNQYDESNNHNFQ